MEENLNASQRDPIELLAESIMEQLRTGKRPELNNYLAAYPELASEIREIYPALAALELHGKPGRAAVDRSAAATETKTAATDPSLPDIRGYQLRRVLGRGGMGVVYEAIQMPLGRTVALKLLPAALWADVQRRERFRQESRAASRLQHSHIVPVYETGECDGVGYYSMAYIRGPSLDGVWQELRRRRGGQPLRLDLPLDLPLDAHPDAQDGANHDASIATTELQAQLRAMVIGSQWLPELGTDHDGEHEHDGEQEVEQNTPPDHGDPTRPQKGASAEAPVAAPAAAARLTSDLAAALDTPTFYRRVAKLGEQLADALAHAHAEGVLHRDIKPSNVLLDEQGGAWLADFGLAKIAGDTSLTETGDVVGTLRFLAPERLEGWSDARGDIYALGATLYELVTLQPIFSADQRSHLLEQILHHEPTAPRRIQRAIPRDLETIIVTAIAKDPAARYGSARQLADDLQRFQRQLPITARRVSVPERAVRWCQRNRWIASLGMLAFVSMLAAVAVLLFSNRTIRTGNNHLQAAVQERTQALQEREQALQERTLALQDARQQEQQAQTSAREARRVASAFATQRGLEAGENRDFPRAALWLAEAVQLTEPGTSEHETSLHRFVAHAGSACRPLAMFHHPHPFDGWVNRLEFQPHGQRLLSRADSLDRAQSDVRVWDLMTTEPLTELPASTAGSWFADGTMLALGTAEGQLHLLPAPFTMQDATTLQVDGPILEVAVSASGRFLAAATPSRIHVWQIAETQDAQEPLPESNGDVSPDSSSGSSADVDAAPRSRDRNYVAIGSVTPSAPVCWLEFAPDEQHLTALAYDTTLTCYTLNTDSPPAKKWTVERVAVPFSYWSPTERGKPRYTDHGKRILCRSSDGASDLRMITVNLTDGEVNVLLETAGEAIEVDASGSLLVNAYMQGEVLDLSQARKELGTFEHRRYQATSAVDFHPDSRLLLVGSEDRHVQFLGTRDAKPQLAPWPHTGIISCVRAADDGLKFATAEAGGMIHVREFAEHGVPVRTSWLRLDQNRVRRGEPAARMVASVSRNGQWFIAGGDTSNGNDVSVVRVARLEDMQEVGSLLMADGVLLGGTFCHQDQYVALLASNIRGNQAANTSTTAGKLHVIDWQDTRRRWTVAFPSEPRSVVAHPHRDELAILRADGKVAIIKIKDDDLEVGRNWSAQPAFHASNFYTNNGQLAYSPDGEQLVVHGSDQRARVYDSQSGKRLYEVEHGGRVNGATFSPSGRWLATAGWGDNRVRIVDAKTGEPAAEDLLHPEWTFTTEFDPTERFLLTTCRDGTVRLWDWRTGQQVAKPMNHAHEVHDARFVRQGNWVVTVCDDASVRIWDARSGDAISPPLRLSDHPYDLALTIAVTPDERHVVIGGPAYRLAVVSLDPSTWPAASTSVAPQPYAELLAGREMREATESQLLTTDWLRRFTDVRQASLLAPPREPSMAVARYRDAAHQELIWGERARTHAVVWNLRRQLAEGLPFDNLNSISRLVPLFTESPEGFKEELRTMVIESLTPDVLQERDWDEAFSDIESALVLGTTWPECPPSQAEIMTQFLEQAPATETSDKRSLHWWFALLRLRSQGPQAALDSLHAARRADSSMSVPRAEDLVVAALAHAKLGNFQTAREWLHLAWAVTRSEVFREPYVDLHRETISVFDNAKEPTGLTRLFPLDQPLAGEETLRSLFPHESISSLDYAAQGEFWLVAQQETVAQDYLEQALKAPSQPLRGLLFAPAQPTVQAASLYLQLYTLHHAQEREQVAKVRQSLRNVYDDFPAPVQLAMVWPLIVTAPQGDTDTWLMTRVATTYEQAEWPDFRLAFAFLLMRQGRSADAIQEFELFEEVMKDPAVSDASRVFVQPELITLGKALALLDLRQVEKAHQMFSDLEARNQDPLNFQTTTGRHFPLFFTARLAMQAFRKELQQRLTLESP